MLLLTGVYRQAMVLTLIVAQCMNSNCDVTPEMEMKSILYFYQWLPSWTVILVTMESLNTHYKNILDTLNLNA